MFLTKRNLSWIAGGTAVAFSAVYVLRKLGLLKKIEGTCQSAINQVLFYGKSYMEDSGTDNLYCISYVILQARHAIEVCLPSLHSDIIINSLLQVKQLKNIKIKLLIYDYQNLDKVVALADQGMEVKVINSDDLAHSFILVDSVWDPPIALIGSLGQLDTIIGQHYGHTLMTSEKSIVYALKMEFDRIWYAMHYTSDDEVDVDLEIVNVQ